MRIAVLQSGNAGFFPRFYNNLYNAINIQGHEASLFSPRTGVNHRTQLKGQTFWGSRLNWHIHNLLFKTTGIKDVYSTLDTLDLIRKLFKYKPDVIHFHVIGECIINLPLIIYYINKKNIPLVWTFHDCRTFTGGCPYFDEVGCDKWKTGCENCPDTKYRSSLIDNTKVQWKIMKRALTGLNNLTIVTPSKWLHDYVKQSFLKEYDCMVIYNGIDQSAFVKADGSQVRKSLGLDNKKIVLGIAANWTARKGLDSFKYLASILPNNYQIVLVGNVSENIPNAMILPPTSDICLLAAYYSMADVFCNPTLADNFPTTNIEALSAGTPVVTYKTGGSPEAIDYDSGIAVQKGNKQMLADAIIKVCTSNKYYSSAPCKDRSKLFGLSQYDGYVLLYQNLVKSRQ